MKKVLRKSYVSSGIGPGVGETALVLLLRWVVETVRQRLALPGEKSVP